MDFLTRLYRDEEGQGLIEYVLIVALIALVAVVAITAAGTSINDIWVKVKNALTGTAATTNP